MAEPPVADLPMRWRCAKCQELNWMHHDYCNKCGAAQPTPATDPRQYSLFR